MSIKLGILGGMGPEATVFTYSELIRINKLNNPGSFTPHIIINSIPHDNIFENLGVELFKEILKGIIDLIKLEVNVIGISCNTAHMYASQFRSILEALNIKFIHLIEEAALHCLKAGYKKVGLLSTTASQVLYSTEFKKYGMECFFPSNNIQLKINTLINKVLSHENTEEDANYVTDVSQQIINDNGANIVILGCTELPILYQNLSQPEFCLSSIEILAHSMLKN